MNRLDLWKRYKKYVCRVPSIGLTLDVSRMHFDETLFESMSVPLARAIEAMAELEAGAIANPDENRMVGHYWLRAPQLAPSEETRTKITDTIAAVKNFATSVHTEDIQPQRGGGFYVVLVIGIGGSALGTQFVGDALGTVEDPMIVRFLDNTDPDGIDRVLGELDETLEQTLTVVVSKSGSTKETRNVMLEVKHAYEKAGLDFGKHAVAVTAEGSDLHALATKDQWLRTFAMWDFVGGRTSVTSAAGLLPAALQGIDIDDFLAGAQACDQATRHQDVLQNPAALLALMWYDAGRGRGERNMVILPYRDRLALLGRYAQQLVMESLGKQEDRSGRVVHQGLTVFGNKGSTDQHAYLQQLLDGPDNFFVTLINTRFDREDHSLFVEDDVTTEDYLHAFFLGTRDALEQKGRQSITITLDKVTPHAVGALIALFERAVGLYAELINVNAYHQPAVKSGKSAASDILDLQRLILKHLRDNLRQVFHADELAAAIHSSDDVERVQHLLDHLSTSRPDTVERIETPSGTHLTYRHR